MPESPLSQAWDAKRNRDLGGELGAIMGGYQALTGAPWYPSRVGDLIQVTYEPCGTVEGFREVYRVIDDPNTPEAKTLELVTHTSKREDGFFGAFAGEPSYGPESDPLETAWMEAGPDRLSITRDGEVVHQGRQS
ncbi:hypothetical protein ABR737_43385 [Streptomyces sp. Edi2]|uniref:hypothetical protein n=1 Tax=Streptomyces sp. Edi2 TaxID=3162528 RepID=UPI003305A889